MRKQMSGDEVKGFIEEVNGVFLSNLVVEGMFFVKDEKHGTKKIFLFTGSHIPEVSVEWLGQHFATVKADGEISLSIEGAEIVGRTAKRIVELSSKQADDLFAGEDVFVDESDGFYIVKSGDRVLCAGKVEGRRLLNPIPKSRRTKQQYKREE